MLIINLTPIFTIRGIDKPFTYLVQNGFTRHAANLLINSKNRVFRLDHIERLCELLVCEPNDLLSWIPETKMTYSDNYPLNKLRPTETSNLKDTLKKTPLSELKLLTDNIVNRKDK